MNFIWVFFYDFKYFITIDEASREKCRIEDKQRDASKNRKDEHQILWFKPEKHPMYQELCWVPNNKYWDRNYNNCPDLF